MAFRQELTWFKPLIVVMLKLVTQIAEQMEFRFLDVLVTSWFVNLYVLSKLSVTFGVSVVGVVGDRHKIKIIYT